ncbi:hypothetical protein [Streptomyces sp. NPDC001975]
MVLRRHGYLLVICGFNGTTRDRFSQSSLKVKRLPHGKVKVTAAAGGALGTIGNVGRALNHLDGQTATTYVVTRYRISGNPNVPSGAYLGSTAGRSANGGLL